MNNWDRDLYNKAWDFATLHHSGQTFGGRTPGMRVDYINHIGAVTMEILWTLQHSTQTYNADLAIQCALLHDVIEDTTVTYEQVKEEFGTDVADGVMALTKNTQFPTKIEQMQDSLRRIQQQPKEVWMVKMADRITNLAPPPHYWNNEKIKAYQQEGQLIYDSLHTAEELLAIRLKERISQYLTFLHIENI
ncbi:HD domain-containing protein [Cytophagaceae bacterium DM2B3-1]|uniref:HD domain-containing protein n=1 Tax=Xanthocytophaga flava TaxID=3048013 RepID=A0ABT7CQC3_9BACT|nr:HD domain-containing protein [Xanthocytophaga flavus]MDJ1468050.1 HD domain-containing protein [Xanthocytophaga flavus]MDJ1495945.1 HD domain-containing protein [Xanthocytophaga flavus]